MRNLLQTDHIKRGEYVAVVVISLQVFSDVRKCRKVFRVLCSTGNVTDFMFSNNILFEKKIFSQFTNQI